MAAPKVHVRFGGEGFEVPITWTNGPGCAVWREADGTVSVMVWDKQEPPIVPVLGEGCLRGDKANG